MDLQGILRDLAEVVSLEAKRNPAFGERLRSVLTSVAPPHDATASTATRPTSTRPAATGASATRRGDASTRRASNRRSPAVLDPVALAVKGEEALRAALAPLRLDQLKDIVADYGMDYDKLAMRWRKAGRIIDRIVEVSMIRAHKGDAFRA